jgi:hypothetical protein
LPTIPTTQIFLSPAAGQHDDLAAALATISGELAPSGGSRIAIGSRQADPVAPMFVEHGYPVETRIAGYIEASGLTWDASEPIGAFHKIVERVFTSCDVESCVVAVSQSRM